MPEILSITSHILVNVRLIIQEISLILHSESNTFHPPGGGA